MCDFQFISTMTRKLNEFQLSPIPFPFKVASFFFLFPVTMIDQKKKKKKNIEINALQEVNSDRAFQSIYRRNRWDLELEVGKKYILQAQPL